MAGEHRHARDRHRPEAGDDALGHVHRDRDRGALRGAGHGEQQDAGRDVLDVVLAAAGRRRARRRACRRRRTRTAAGTRAGCRSRTPPTPGSAACGEGCGAASSPSPAVRSWSWRCRSRSRARKTSSRSGVWTERPSTSTASRRGGPARRAASRMLPSLGTCSARLVVAARAPSASAAVSSLRAVGELAAGCARRPTSRLSSSGVPSATISPRSSTRDPVGELVGLLEVLGGEEDGHAAGHELADDRPHRAPAARVQPRRRLVEEDDPRVADERHRQVEPAPHAAAVGRGGAVGRVGEVEALEQLVGAPARLGAAEMVAGRPSASGSPARSAGCRPPRTGR